MVEEQRLCSFDRLRMCVETLSTDTPWNVLLCSPWPLWPWPSSSFPAPWHFDGAWVPHGPPSENGLYWGPRCKQLEFSVQKVALSSHLNCLFFFLSCECASCWSRMPACRSRSRIVCPFYPKLKYLHSVIACGHLFPMNFEKDDAESLISKRCLCFSAFTDGKNCSCQFYTQFIKS